jgi:hypothetical protein
MPLSRKSGFVLAACLALSLSGCETSDLIDSMQAKVQDFNPFGVTKTPLKGERREVFPDGVPGVQQGIPPELMKGSQTIPDPNAPPDVALAAPEPEKTEEAEKPKPKPKRQAARPKPAAHQAVKRKPAAQQPAAEEEPAQAAPQVAWPAPPAANQAAAPAPQWPTPSSQPAPTVWPDPPKPGQFTR